MNTPTGADVLEDRLADAVDSLRLHHRVNARQLPQLGRTVECRSIVIQKAIRTYDDYFRADVLDFSATRDGYGLLAATMLSVLLHGASESVSIRVTHPSSAIDVIRVLRPTSVIEGLGLRMDRTGFVLTTSRDEAVEALIAADPIGKPGFLLYEEDLPAQAHRWADRHRVRLEASDTAFALLVSALLDYSSHGDPERELALFGPPRTGAEALRAGSAEVRFWLPGGFGWFDG